MIFKHGIKSLREKELISQFTALLDEIRPSIVNIHNLHSAELPISLIQTALDFSPVVWTLHDCWSFSATYYPTYCPSPDRSQERKISDFWQTIKQQSNNQKLSAITPSKWLQERALASMWEGRKVESIHNPIPDFFFERQDRTACKRALGLSDENDYSLYSGQSIGGTKRWTDPQANSRILSNRECTILARWSKYRRQLWFP